MVLLDIHNHTARLLHVGGSVTLLPGVNHVPKAIWEALFAKTPDGNSGPGDTAATRAMLASHDGKKPMLEVKGEVPGTTTHDGKEVADIASLGEAQAKTMVSSAFDLKQLKAWKELETRSSVAQAIDAQIKRVTPPNPDDKKKDVDGDTAETAAASKHSKK